MIYFLILFQKKKSLGLCFAMWLQITYYFVS